MTIAEYIGNKFSTLGLPEGCLTDYVLSNPDLDTTAEITTANLDAAMRGTIGVIADFVLAPKVESVSESGFSVSYDYGTLAKYYLSLCRKYGVTPDNNVLALAGVAVITDRSCMW